MRFFEDSLNIKYLVVLVGTILVLKGVFVIVIPGILLNLVCLFVLVLLALGSLINQEVVHEKKVLLLLLVIMIVSSLYQFIFSGLYVFRTKLFLVALSQFVFPLLVTYVLFSLSMKQLMFVYRYFRTLVLFLCIVAAVEVFLVPDSIRDLIAVSVLRAKVSETATLASYKDSLFGFEWTRAGSLVFEPLTFGVVTSIILIAEIGRRGDSQKIRNLFLVLGVVFSGIKSALMILFFSFHFVLFKKYSKKLLCLFFFLILCVLLLNTQFVLALLQAERIYGLHSVSNHLIGLLLGLKNAFESPFFGHGLGTSGYLVYIEAKNIGIDNIFRDDGGIGIGLANGNESGIAVITYQLGYVFTFYLLFTFYKSFKYFYKSQLYNISGLIIGLMAFLFLSESGLGFAIQFIALLTIVYKYRENESSAG